MGTVSKQVRTATRFASIAMIVLFAFAVAALAQGGRYKVNPWSFGVMGDTQWFSDQDPEGVNPEYVSAGIAKALQRQFIANDVKFVIQTGDLSDRSGDGAMTARAEAAQTLFDAGIGFFPIRGNHETYGYLYGRDPEWNLNIPAFRSSFPQTQGQGNTFGATNFSSPAIDAIKGLSYSFDYGDQGNNATFVLVDVEATSWTITNAPVDPVYGQGYFYLGWTVFKSATDLPGLVGTYDEATKTWTAVPGTVPANTWFRVSSGQPSTNFYGYNTNVPGDDPYDWYYPIDIYATATQFSTAGSEVWPGAQQSWIDARLDKNSRETEHAFVLSHRPVMGANHADGFFGSSPASKPDQQNPFYASLVNNGVRYMISGHDHIHNRALVSSPDGSSQIQQIINTGASTKFYMPNSLDKFSNTKQRETQISQEVHNIGYYIYTVDGPRVTVDYYSDATGGFQDGADFPRGVDSIPAALYTPQFHFVKKESWGYSKNGRQFVIAQGDSYTAVSDSFGTTAARILAGTNNSTSTDYTPTVIDAKGTPDDPSDDVTVSAPRPLVKTVNTGWVPNPDPEKLYSDILSLWGMSELGAEGMTDTYVLEMTYVDPRDKGKGKKNGNAGIRLCSLDKNGHWVNAVNLNIGQKNAKDQKFVNGPWEPGYKLGTYGIDMEKGTVWAVINYNADFVATN